MSVGPTVQSKIVRRVDKEGPLGAKKPPSGEPIVWTFHWLKWADTDYLAARYLLLGGMVINGAALANTAIEKYLKAFSVHLGLPTERTHSTLDLYAAIIASRKSSIALDESFLAVLEKAYAFRYPDELPIGFNFALNEMRVLAELDRTVFEIVKAFKFEVSNPAFVLPNPALLRDERLLAKNVALNPEAKDSFSNLPSQSFEFRVTHTRICQADYLSPRVDDDGIFDLPARTFLGDHGDQAVFPPRRGKRDQEADVFVAGQEVAVQSLVTGHAED
jgi:HEPN domain-containing protein